MTVGIDMFRMMVSDARNGSNQELESKLWSIAARRRKDSPLLVLPEALHQPFDLPALFDSSYDKYDIELGVGWGEVALQRAIDFPDRAQIGFEIKWDRISKILKKIQRAGIGNLKIAPLNFKWFYDWLFPPDTLDNIYVYFPDPWPKRRHWKHRLVNTAFIDASFNFLKTGGTFHFCTDYGPYARKVIRTMRRISAQSTEPSERTERTYRPTSLLPNPGYIRSDKPVIHSRFEQIQMADGYRPFYLQYQKEKPGPAQP